METLKKKINLWKTVGILKRGLKNPCLKFKIDFQSDDIGSYDEQWKVQDVIRKKELKMQIIYKRAILKI